MKCSIKKVATCGCEIRNENDEIVAWSVDDKWANLIVLALELFLRGKKNENS